MRVFIIYESSGSHDNYHKDIYKIYADESVANAECDRLNLELKNDKKKYGKILESNSCTCHDLPDEEWEECERCEAQGALWILDEQWDYTVEGVDVE